MDEIENNDEKKLPELFEFLLESMTYMCSTVRRNTVRHLRCLPSSDWEKVLILNRLFELRNDVKKKMLNNKLTILGFEIRNPDNYVLGEILGDICESITDILDARRQQGNPTGAKNG